MLDDLAIYSGHRYADRHLVESELKIASCSDAQIAIKRSDKPARVGMSVDRRHRGAGVSENAQVRRAISLKPRIDFPGRSAGEEREVIVEIQPCREYAPCAGQHHPAILELGFQPVEGAVEIVKKGRVLCVRLVCVHCDQRDMLISPLDGPGHGSLHW